MSGDVGGGGWSCGRAGNYLVRGRGGGGGGVEGGMVGDSGEAGEGVVDVRRSEHRMDY